MRKGFSRLPRLILYSLGMGLMFVALIFPVTASIARHPKLAVLLAGFLSATGFAPLSLWPVTLICLTLLLHLIERAPDRRAAFLRGWLFGVGHFTLGLNWIAHAFTFQDSMPHWFGYGAVIVLSLYLAIYPGLATLGAWWLRGRLKADGALRFILLLAACWIGTEYLRATLVTGFAWNPLGVVWMPTGVALAATVIGCWLFYAIGRSIGWLRPLIGLQKR